MKPIISNNKSKVRVVLVPYAGLCNRMNAIASTLKLVEDEGYSLSIWWESNSDLSADFEDLFEKHILDPYLNKLRWNKILKYRARPMNLFIPKFLRYFFYTMQFEDISRKSNDFKSKIRYGRNYISTCHAIGEKKDLNSLFVPVKTIRDRIEKVKKTFPDYTVGIHIRRTDHDRCIQDSSIEDFKAKMDVEIKKNPDVGFFLATDDEEVKEHMKTFYGERIITMDNSLSRISKDGMEDAVVDLWALSGTDKIIGSYYSTYSLVAAELGGIELEF